MNKDKITIISGEPRSGTSLMMQTIKHLGQIISGTTAPQEDKLKHFKDAEGNWLPEHLDKKEDIERRVKHSEMMNPVGFYETEFVSRGVRGVEAEKFKGTMMKIITSGIPVHYGPHGMTGTDKKLIEKIILCTRHPKNIAVSQKNLINDTVLVAGKEGEGWIYHDDAPPSPLAFIQRTGSFVKWLDENKDMIPHILVVEYEDIHENPAQQIQRVIDFLDIEPEPGQIQAAIDNVRPSLKRSKSFEEWPENFKEDGELAMVIYDAVRSLGDEEITFAVSTLDSRQLKFRREGAQWIDCNRGQGTWTPVGPELYRNIANNKNDLKTKLLPNGKNNDSTLCRHYSETDKEYTIQRPEDLGPLTRPMVFCRRDEDHRTVEQCNHCYTFGWKRCGQFVAPAKQSNLTLA